VRRFLLYDTLLHELGHLQLVRPKGRTWDRRVASETLAEQFATLWRRRLYSEPFDHSDPVHNAPTEDERTLLPVWERLDKLQRERLVHQVLTAPLASILDLAAVGATEASHIRFLNPVLCFHCK
jgi:hypothetical protein